MKTPLVAVLASLALSGGCAFGGRPRAEPRQAGPEERLILESSTLTSLALLEASVGTFTRDKGRPPARLEDLVPDHIGQLPVVELGLAAHPDAAEAFNYGPGVLENGALREGMLRDSGRWGYAVEGGSARVFVDCTHESSRGRPWFKERGAL